MLKKLLLAGIAGFFATSTALAADISEPAAYDWSGPYVGLQAGYGWDKPGVNLDKSPALADIDQDARSFNRDGFIGGVFAGYLLQRDSLVFGVEGDIEYADMDGSTKAVQGGTIELGRLESNIDWLASLRLRTGFAVDRALFYATGGLAIGGAELDFSPTPGPFLNMSGESDTATKVGWTLGGGIDYALADNLSLRVEYRYTDLGKLDVRASDNVSPAVFEDLEVKNAFHAVRAGVSWRF
jgi:outer membrane immunogenic protein